MRLTPVMLKKSFSAPILQTVFLYIFIMQSSLPGLVLCIGQGGHLELETASEAFRCESPLKADSEQLPYPSALLAVDWNNGCCGPCTDVPVSIATTDKNIISVQAMNPEIEIIISLSPLTFLPAYSEIPTGRLVQQTPPINFTVSSAQTVVLLC